MRLVKAFVLSAVYMVGALVLLEGFDLAFRSLGFKWGPAVLGFAIVVWCVYIVLGLDERKSPSEGYRKELQL